MKNQKWTVLWMALLMMATSVAEASSSGSIKSIFAEKSLTCGQKYSEAIVQLTNHENHGSQGLVAAGMCIGGLYGGLPGVIVGCSIATTYIFVDAWRTGSRIKKLRTTKYLLEVTADVLKGHQTVAMILLNMYNSKREDFSKYIPSYEGIAWTIEEAVETGKACEQGKPWTVNDFRKYALLRLKQRQEEIIENAKKAALLPEEPVLVEDKE